MHPRHYRLRFLLDVVRAVILPQLLLALIIRLIRLRATPFLKVMLHIAFVPGALSIREYYSSRVKTREAAAMGASEIPTVRGKWPGNVDILLKMVKGLKTGYVLQVMDDLFEEYNCETLNTRVLWTDQILTKDESNVKFMLTGQGFDWFGKGYWWQERMESFLGNGIFNRDGDEWRTHRNIIRPFFAKERISDFRIMERHYQAASKLLEQFSIPGGERAFDAQDLFARLTLDISTEFLFGKSIDSLNLPLPIAGKARMGPKGSATDDSFGSFTRAFEDIQSQISVRTRLGQNWPLFELVYDKTASNSRVLHDWLFPIVESAIHQKNKNIEENDEAGTFLEHLVSSSDDKETVKFQVLNMLVAGRDTTAALLTFAVYFLATHPDRFQRLQSEILGFYGRDGVPSFDSMKNHKYLRAVLQETLRLFPPVPMNIRTPGPHSRTFPPSDTATKQYIPANSQIIYMTLLIQRKLSIWGNDADTFSPERWLEAEKVKIVTSNPFVFLPFHAGPRICLGQNMAYNMASYVLIQLLQRYSRFVLEPSAQPQGSIPPVEWKDGNGRQAYEKCWPASSVTIFVKGGLWVRFIRDEP